MKYLLVLIIVYLARKVIDKLIDDNLPNLNYKNLLKPLIPIFLLLLVVLLPLVIKLVKNSQQKKALKESLLLASLALVLPTIIREGLKKEAI